MARDEDLVVALLEKLSASETPSPDSDLVRWATQTLLLRPVHGFVAVANRPGETAPEALAVVSVHLDPVRGWAGDLVRYWVAPEPRDRKALASWFTEEVLEMARYRGVNRVRLPEAALEALGPAAGRAAWLDLDGRWAVLTPHFDGGPEPDEKPPKPSRTRRIGGRIPS